MVVSEHFSIFCLMGCDDLLYRQAFLLFVLLLLFFLFLILRRFTIICRLRFFDVGVIEVW